MSPRGNVERGGRLLAIVSRWRDRLHRRALLTCAIVLLAAALPAAGCARPPRAAEPAEGVVGLTPVPADRTFLMEDHGYALAYWLQLGVRGATVVHVDAHDDFREIPPARLKPLADAVESRDSTAVAGLNGTKADDAYDLGDYLYAAAKTGVVSRVFWVVPEDLGAGDDALREVRRRLEAQGYRAGDIATMRAEGNAVSGRLYGVPVTIAPLEGLEVPEGRVLLDIDMDYFTLDLGLTPYDNATGAVKTLVEGLRKARVRPTAVTVATSTEGGYLPMQYRWLTSLLTLSLRQPSVLSTRPPDRYGIAGDAIAKERSADMTAAVDAWGGMTGIAPRDPAGWFGLGRALTLTGDLDAGRDALARAVGIDGAYRWGYVQLASELSAGGRPDEALSALDLADGVDPAIVELRRGDVLYNARRYEGALEVYRDLSEASSHPDVWMFLGDTYAALGREGDAMGAYAKGEEALGKVSFRSMRDYPDALPYLARLAGRRGDRAEARRRYSLYLELQPDGAEAGRVRDALGKL